MRKRSREEEEHGEVHDDKSRASPDMEPSSKRRKLVESLRQLLQSAFQDTLSEGVLPSSLNKGEHIYVWRHCAYKHHCICSASMNIIHKKK